MEAEFVSGQPVAETAVPALEQRSRVAPIAFLITILVGSFLLFLMQPLVARMALPRLGGAPAVWNSAMLVYQALLLAGYAYAHWLGRAPLRLQWAVHLALFAAAALWLPIGVAALVPSRDAVPELWVPWFLIVSIGPLFFVAAAQAPLMQRWFAHACPAADPYRLYIASNLGSFAGLLAYPLLVEPRLTLVTQSRLWTGGYLILALLVFACSRLLPKRSTGAAPPSIATAAPEIARGRVARWIVLAAIPSGLILSTTAHLTTDIVAMPLLWVVPLGLYLLSFSLAFSRLERLKRAVAWAFPIALIADGGIAMAGENHMVLVPALIDLGLLFVASTAIHARVHRLRPAPERLTGFYLAIAFGGMLGGLFCALVAPLVFDWPYEHPLLLIAAALAIGSPPLAPVIGRIWRSPARAFWLKLASGIAILWLAILGAHLLVRLPDRWELGCALALALVAAFAASQRLLFVAALAGLMLVRGGADTIRISTDGGIRTRSYFGVYSMVDRGDRHELVHGTTLHGIQFTTPGKETLPTSYYAPGSGVGIAMRAVPALYGLHARIGVVGLGSGTLACYRRPGQQWRIYEIDPKMIGVARDPAKFSFLARCAPRVPILLGDARLSLSREPAASLDLLAIDAFSSDSVPMHLLTREAFAVYGRVLARDGLLLVHISNRFLDLQPVIAAAAAGNKWLATLVDYSPDDVALADGAGRSIWVVMARDPDMIGRLVDRAPAGITVWEDLSPQPGFAPWTDDYASVLPILRGLQ